MNINTISPILITLFIIWMNIYVNMKPEWYEQVPKPWFKPPNYLFPIIWTFTYIYFTYSWVHNVNNNFVSWFYIFYIILNGYWTYMFFEMKRLLISVILILLMIYVCVVLSLYTKDRIFFMIHIIWLFYAFFMNVYFLNVLNDDIVHKEPLN